MSGPASGGVFISYRRQESSGLAGRLYDRLADRFGDDQVFMDVDTIALGVDFAEVITQAVSTCEVLLAVIGPHWLTTTDEDGRRRLDNPDDFVRLEIAAALERNIRVIPILIEGAQMPRHQELPDTLAKLARRNALSVRHESFRADADRLLAAIEPILRPPASEVPVSSGPGRPGTPPPRAADTEAAATASTAETTTPAGVRPDTGWSSTQVRTFLHPSRSGGKPSEPVSALAFSPNGRWLATGSMDETARLWELSSGQQLHTLTHTGWVRSVAISPDGRWLATTTGKTIQIWDTSSGQRLHTLTHDLKMPQSVPSDSDRPWLTHIPEDLEEAAEKVARLPLRYPVDVKSVAFGPDGRWLATCTLDGTTRIWDTSSGQQLQTLFHESLGPMVTFSPDGRWLATTALNATLIWETRSGKQLQTLSHGSDIATQQVAAFSPDRRWLATWELDRTTRLWDTSSGEQLHTLTHDGSEVGRWRSAPMVTG